MRAYLLTPCVLALACVEQAQPPAEAPPAPPTAEAPLPEPPQEPQVAPSDEGPQPGDAIARALASSERPQEDRDRDAARKPAQVLRFFEVSNGQRVVDLMAGKGYYTELLARVVGETGEVFAQNNRFVLERFAHKPLSERLARPGMEHVSRLDTELDTPSLPQDLDRALMVLFYHDTYWQKVDRKAMNRAVFKALKPGGIYGVVDHHAAEGSGDQHVKTLHRIDAALVKKEVLEAGFVLDGESDALGHPQDDRTKNVFDPSIRGKTDRFIYRFRKPVADADRNVE